MSESEFQFVRMVGFAAAAGFAFVLQRLRPYDPLYRTRQTNLVLWVIDAVVMSAACGACACTVARWANTAHVGLLNVVNVPSWAGTLVSVPALDFVSYAWHRANHRLPFLWRFHQVHHSDLSFTVSTALRFHPGELLLSLPIRLLAVALVGAPAIAVVTFEIVFAFANLFEHGNIRLPLQFEQRLAGVIVTPALHRRHHANQLPNLDSNFGTILCFWDRTLGTYAKSSSALRVETGLPGNDARVLTTRQALLLPLGRR
ncbi:MAG TPA: sterol desaturase family protein [Candidatus Acidoferrales bacterium]|nr:sterol desaturase family protein [Candidatus Acidoferrales bacterium]